MTDDATRDAGWCMYCGEDTVARDVCVCDRCEAWWEAEGPAIEQLAEEAEARGDAWSPWKV